MSRREASLLHLGLGVPASRTVKNYIMLLKPHGLWHFITSAKQMAVSSQWPIRWCSLITTGLHPNLPIIHWKCRGLIMHFVHVKLPHVPAQQLPDLCSPNDLQANWEPLLSIFREFPALEKEPNSNLRYIFYWMHMVFTPMWNGKSKRHPYFFHITWDENGISHLLKTGVVFLVEVTPVITGPFNLPADGQSWLPCRRHVEADSGRELSR